MLDLARNPNPLYRRFYIYGVIGILLVSMGYMLRPALSVLGNPVAFVMGLFPNLLGSFGTPFILLLIAVEVWKRPDLLRNLPAFGLINLFTLAVALLIEIAHPVFNLGSFHIHDLLASVVGGAVAVLIYDLTTRLVPDQQKNR